MNLKTLLILPILFSTAYSQEVLWADRVLEVSSEHTDQQYSPINRADQILGSPSVFPQFGKSPCAWQPNGSDFGEDYIKVSFPKSIVVKQVGIVENVNAGCIVRIFGYDNSGTEYLLFQNTDFNQKPNGRFWQIKIANVSQPIKSLKFLISHRISKGIKQYDAIAISDSDIPIKAGINLAKDIPENLQKENLGPSLNSRYGELAPLITPDGKTLYFTRNGHPDNIINPKNKDGRIGQDIYYAKLSKSNTWDYPTNIGSPINNDQDNAAATVSAEGNSLYILNVYNKSGTMGPGLSVTRLRNGNWEFPEEVKIMNFQALPRKKDNASNDNDVTTNTEFSISHDKQILIMGLKRSQTFGDNDLYVSFLQKDGTYSIPVNLGKIINTADNEGSPFLSADNKTLYFSSKGHPGYGDADIYVTRRLDETWTSWTEPENLGPQINSPYWDGYFSLPASGDFAYLSSKDNSIGAEDIFKIKLFESIKPDPVALINAKILDASDGNFINADLEIKVLNDTTGRIQVKIEFDEETEEYKVIVPIGYKYRFFVAKEGYMSKEEELDLSNDNIYREIKRTFELLPVKEGQKMVLNQLYFEQGKFEIMEESFEELQTIIELMKNYPKMRVLLEGHSDNQGDFRLNVELSENRVNAVRDYLTRKGGINKNRIEIKAWGPMKPISSNSDEESRKKNRRVEFTILKM